MSRIHWWRLFAGAAVLCAAAVWRAVGFEGHVFKESGRLPQLRLGDLLTVPLTVVGLAAVAGAFDIERRRQIIAALLILAGLLYPLCSYPWDGRVVWGRHHHGLHSTDGVSLLPLTLGSLLLVLSPRRTIRPT